MLNKTLGKFFRDYSAALANYSIDDLAKFYHTPCLLSSPDNLVLLNTAQAFKQNFSATLASLSAANVCAFKALDTCYQIINPSLILVNIIWQFFDHKQFLFTEFSATYQLVNQNDKWQIVQVISQDIEQALALENPFTLQEER